MIPLSDENPTLRTPVVTIALLVVIAAVWLFVQGAGLDAAVLATTVCDLGLVAGELTGRAPVGTSVAIADGMSCVVDAHPINVLTPLTSMFLHGGWAHLIGNCVFLWVFGNNVEDGLGRIRFLVFYLICGFAAAAAQVLADPSSAVPMVGASGAISGVMGAYVVLYPQARVRLLLILVITFRVVVLPAWAVLLYWFALQVLEALPQLAGVQASGGVAVMAHVGGFVAGAALVKLFENASLTSRRQLPA